MDKIEVALIVAAIVAVAAALIIVPLELMTEGSGGAKIAKSLLFVASCAVIAVGIWDVVDRGKMDLLSRLAIAIFGSVASVVVLMLVVGGEGWQMGVAATVTIAVLAGLYIGIRVSWKKWGEPDDGLVIFKQQTMVPQMRLAAPPKLLVSKATGFSFVTDIALDPATLKVLHDDKELASPDSKLAAEGEAQIVVKIPLIQVGREGRWVDVDSQTLTLASPIIYLVIARNRNVRFEVAFNHMEAPRMPIAKAQGESCAVIDKYTASCSFFSGNTLAIERANNLMQRWNAGYTDYNQDQSLATGHKLAVVFEELQTASSRRRYKLITRITVAIDGVAMESRDFPGQMYRGVTDVHVLPADMFLYGNDWSTTGLEAAVKAMLNASYMGDVKMYARPLTTGELMRLKPVPEGAVKR
jgi:hypothetical protein